MGSLVATDIIVKVTKRWRAGRKHFATGTLQIAGAANETYPNNGIPLPAVGKFGMYKYLDSLVFFGVDPVCGTVADYLARWDKTNHKLFLYEEEASAAGGPLLECDTAEVPGKTTGASGGTAPRIYNFLAVGW